MESPSPRQSPKKSLVVLPRRRATVTFAKKLLKVATPQNKPELERDPDPDPDPLPAGQFKLSRRASVRQIVYDGLGRIRPSKSRKQPLRNASPRAQSPRANPPRPKSPRAEMSVFQPQAAQNNGGPVHQPGLREVINLVSDDEDDDFFEDAPELENRNRVKREKHELGNGKAQEHIPQMGGRNPAGILAERAPNNAIVPENPFAPPRDVWGDYDLDEEFDDEFLEAFEFNQQFPINPVPANPAVQAPPVAPPVQQHIPAEVVEMRVDCVDTILSMFPDICRDYVSELYDTVSKSSERLIAHILDKMDKGSSYPNAKEKQKQLKRKRDVDEDAEAARKYGAPDRVMPTTIGGIRSFISKILSIEFPLTSMQFIHATLGQTGYRLFSAYEVLEEAQRTWATTKPYQRLKSPRKGDDYTEKKVVDYLASPSMNNYIDLEKVEVFQELQAARRVRCKADARRAAERAAEIEEEENVARAIADGTMAECGCCCCDYPLNRMVHCNGEILRWFCRGCAKQNAEVEIGKSKYELQCMSTVTCTAGFSLDQRKHFLDENTQVALERNEQEANLRMAGIENLESCPFCPFAAEYPPVEVDREFRCQAPDCERVSCRMCKLESHIPKTCDENAKDNGLSIRRQIEEAMSAAMIRKCNKCGTPFVKEEGCNKMTCTRNGCRNLQCYVCSESCDYAHFNDPSRGGKVGNCPLFEKTEERHDTEVKRAEKEALQKILADHPEYTEEDLTVKMSENVKKDDENRKTKQDPRARLLEAQLAGIRRPALGAAMNLMDLQPMIPHPAAIVPRAHHLPEYPQLLPDPIDYPAFYFPGMDPFHGDHRGADYDEFMAHRLEVRERQRLAQYEEMLAEAENGNVNANVQLGAHRPRPDAAVTAHAALPDPAANGLARIGNRYQAQEAARYEEMMRDNGNAIARLGAHRPRPDAAVAANAALPDQAANGVARNGNGYQAQVAAALQRSRNVQNEMAEKKEEHVDAKEAFRQLMEQMRNAQNGLGGKKDERADPEDVFRHLSEQIAKHKAASLPSSSPEPSESESESDSDNDSDDEDEDDDDNDVETPKQRALKHLAAKGRLACFNAVANGLHKDQPQPLPEAAAPVASPAPAAAPVRYFQRPPDLQIPPNHYNNPELRFIDRMNQHLDLMANAPERAPVRAPVQAPAAAPVRHFQRPPDIQVPPSPYHNPEHGRFINHVNQHLDLMANAQGPGPAPVLANQNYFNRNRNDANPPPPPPLVPAARPDPDHRHYYFEQIVGAPNGHLAAVPVQAPARVPGLSPAPVRYPARFQGQGQGQGQAQGQALAQAQARAANPNLRHELHLAALALQTREIEAAHARHLARQRLLARVAVAEGGGVGGGGGVGAPRLHGPGLNFHFGDGFAFGGFLGEGLNVNVNADMDIARFRRERERMERVEREREDERVAREVERGVRGWERRVLRADVGRGPVVGHAVRRPPAVAPAVRPPAVGGRGERVVGGFYEPGEWVEEFESDDEAVRG